MHVNHACHALLKIQCDHASNLGINQTLQCPVLTVRSYPWSAGSWQVFHIVGLCVFSHQSADSRRVIKRPLLADRHRWSCLAWCLARGGWNLTTWRKIHWSDENWFLLHGTDSRVRVYTYLVASGWLSKWGTATGCKTFLMYWSPVGLPCMVTKSSLQSWEIHPANCPLRWRLSNGLRVYLSWLQAGFSHHTRQPNWWSVHQKLLW
jgi:hypothetical protein